MYTIEGKLEVEGFWETESSMVSFDSVSIGGSSSITESPPQPNRNTVVVKSKRCGLGRLTLTMVAKKDYSLIQNTHSPSGKPRNKSKTLPRLIILDEN